ncbi:hypothetical protein, partial [Nonomuraea angiospora]
MIRQLLAELPGARVFFAGIDDVAPLYPATASASAGASTGARRHSSGTACEDRQVVDLDRDLLEPPAETEQVGEVLVLAKTPADLRRIATLHKLLPQAERVVVAVLDTPAA